MYQQFCPALSLHHTVKSCERLRSIYLISQSAHIRYFSCEGFAVCIRGRRHLWLGCLQSASVCIVVSCPRSFYRQEDLISANGAKYHFVTWSKHIWVDEYPLCESPVMSMAAYTTLFEFPLSQMNPPSVLPPSVLPSGLALSYWIYTV